MKEQKFNEKQINHVLTRDPLEQAEKTFGKRWDRFSDEEMSAAMVLNMVCNAEKEHVMREMKDTHFSMSWNEFEEILASNGFKIGYEEKFPYEDRFEKEVVFCREDGLLIWATSFSNMTSVNGGQLYGEIQLRNVEDRMNIPRCSNGFLNFEEKKLHFEADVREGLIYFINQMQKYGEFLPRWEEEHKFLWFLNFSQEEKNSNDYREISRQKMNMFSDGAKKIVEKYL